MAISSVIFAFHRLIVIDKVYNNGASIHE